MVSRTSSSERELHGRLLDPAAPLHVHAASPVDHDLLHRRVGEEVFQRPEADRLSRHEPDQVGSAGLGQNRGLPLDELGYSRRDVSAEAPRRGVRAALAGKPAAKLGDECIGVPPFSVHHLEEARWATDSPPGSSDPAGLDFAHAQALRSPAADRSDRRQARRHPAARRDP